MHRVTMKHLGNTIEFFGRPGDFVLTCDMNTPDFLNKPDVKINIEKVDPNQMHTVLMCHEPTALPYYRITPREQGNDPTPRDIAKCLCEYIDAIVNHQKKENPAEKFIKLMGGSHKWNPFVPWKDVRCCLLCA